MRRIRCSVLFVVASMLPVWATVAATDTILILHTNDLHDHARPRADGIGGLPYIGGYIESECAGRVDTLVLDAGDVVEKGDMMPFITKGAVMYEAMGRIGYDASAMGNHDDAYGIPQLLKCAGLAGDMTILCANFVDESGKLYFPPSKVFDVDGVKVGVIGLNHPKGEGHYLGMKDSAKAAAAEAERLEPQVHLLLVLCHMGSRDCAVLSKLVPDIDVFVSGHTHEAIAKPVVVKETGALIVQAGQYASHVGRLELTIDLDTEKITDTGYELVLMRQDTVPCDTALLAWLNEREQEACPEASRVVGRCESSLGLAEAGVLAAAALRWRAKADIGLCHSSHVMRGTVPAGDVDVNGLFLTGGQRGYKIVTTTMTGSEIVAYLDGLMAFEKGSTQWAGFQAASYRPGSRAKRKYKTDLDPERQYRVVLPEFEWIGRVQKVFANYARPGDAWDASLPKRTVSPCEFSFTEAVTAYVEELDEPIDVHEQRLDAQRQLSLEGS